ncbi:hypothetical protein K504DRAFT_448557 [Pleomassaria siparia CBS 279.74]|uniref:RNA polymerase II subunit B1 CTD phosphatase RPAP2 homolog n=1 Tax=Pleomassaria siparia CBS 279.74 TaxID=1314801 RepID=A0A6G1JYZ8_9PLEO|nr:hypothetical protein K504DRAFT_448557 [Pleomassaria siparia CBS 279.74]
MAPKSILKTPTVSTNAPLSSSTKPVTQRQRNTAIYHANIISQQKNVENEVLEAILTLLDFPASPDADPSRPSAPDALRFQELIMPFQPSDYDSLLEERNLNGSCGYALCPRPKRRAPSTARKHFRDTTKGVEIVDKKMLEVWCSDDCARRALYVKVQLNEEPAWIRQGGASEKIELMVDNAEEHHNALPLRLKRETAKATPKILHDDEDDAAAAWAARDDALADLAIERGEKPGRLSKANKDLITAQIKERVGNAPPVPPSLPSQTMGPSHMAIEGHIPGSAGRAVPVSDEEEDDDTQDWDKHLPG